jgi:hypothetical protein
VAGALALGVLAGASLAPAPPSSLASSSTIVTRLLALLAAQGGGGTHRGTPRARAYAREWHPKAGHTQPTRTVAHTAPTASGSSAAASSPSHSSEGSPSEGSSPSGSGSGEGEKKPVRLPPISHVWLIVVNGTGFAAASAAPASYPYLTGQLLKAGRLLERYSAIEGYELAGDAALLTGGVGESVSTISEPAGDQAEADSFLQRVVAPILASSAYGERGLVVVTFGAAAQEAGLTTTLAAQPAAGALLLSPVLKAGGHSSEAFNSLAPRESLERIFGHS